MHPVHDLAEVAALAGADLGVSQWLEVDQHRIDTFAQATGDQQWIHVDPERAVRGPFGSTIAHGYLTLSLVVPLLWELISFPPGVMVVNYGLNKVRFPAPVPAASRVRLRATVVSTVETKSGIEVVLGLAVEIEGGDRPACVAEAVYRLVIG